MPKINKLNSSSWLKTKRSIEKKIKDISQELIQLYVIRSKTKSDIYKDYPEELIFANEFEYMETPDQLKAIIDVNNDLKSAIPMDR